MRPIFVFFLLALGGVASRSSGAVLAARWRELTLLLAFSFSPGTGGGSTVLASTGTKSSTPQLPPQGLDPHATYDPLQCKQICVLSVVEGKVRTSLFAISFYYRLTGCRNAKAKEKA